MNRLTPDRLRDLLPASSIVLDGSATNQEDAIRQVGALLVAAGRVGPEYVEAMIEREAAVSTFVGDGVALPHGTSAVKVAVVADGLAVLRLAEAIDWGGERVSLVIGIAARGRGYIALLGQLASALLEIGGAEALSGAKTTEEVYAALGGVIDSA
ncbi:MAG: mannitol system component [Actinomycetota bacterium]|nr:mannitol system component [Actinomycetota bacterium]